MAESAAPWVDGLSPHDLAIKRNHWTISIRDLDVTLDRLQARASMFAKSNLTELAEPLREAERLVREVRDGLLAANYDANRKGEAVKT